MATYYWVVTYLSGGGSSGRFATSSTEQTKVITTNSNNKSSVPAEYLTVKGPYNKTQANNVLNGKAANAAPAKKTTTTTTPTLPLLIQPPFDPKMAYSGATNMGVSADSSPSAPVRKGFMIWDQNLKSVLGMQSTGGVAGLGGRDKFNFLFNPSQVSASFSNNNSALQAVQMYGTSTGSAAVPLMQTANWTLYFDRTFEINYGMNWTAANNPEIIGVQADVMQLMQFTGMTANLNLAEVNGTTSISNYTGASVGSGIMELIQCYVYFGAVNNLTANAETANVTVGDSNPLGAQQYALGYYGYISAWDVTYTHWTSEMIPVRCEIDITFTMLPAPTTSSETNGALAQGTLNKLLGIGTTPMAANVWTIGANGGIVNPYGEGQG